LEELSFKAANEGVAGYDNLISSGIPLSMLGKRQLKKGSSNSMVGSAHSAVLLLLSYTRMARLSRLSSQPDDLPALRQRRCYEPGSMYSTACIVESICECEPSLFTMLMKHA